MPDSQKLLLLWQPTLSEIMVVLQPLVAEIAQLRAAQVPGLKGYIKSPTSTVK